MTLRIKLAPKTEAELRRRAAEAGKDPTDFVREALEEKLSAIDDSATAEAASLPPGQRVQALLRWVESHRPVGHAVDDSRDSIYEGRGE